MGKTQVHPRKNSGVTEKKTQVWEGKNSGFRKLSDPVVVVKVDKKACETSGSTETLVMSVIKKNIFKRPDNELRN